jgi:hypothetical protein
MERYSTAKIINCLITGNRANQWGGGIYCHTNFPPSITGCTITGNSAGEDTGGIKCYSTDVPIMNCIVWGNTDEEITGDFIVSYSDVEGDISGEGNIDADPCFFDPVVGDYHLMASSPCIEGGSPDYIAAPGETDIDGEWRVMGGRVDIGADEFAPEPTPAATIIVGRNGAADFTTIQAAIIYANDGDTIIVTDGTYTGEDNRNIVFLGKAVTLRSENGPQSCFIDCEGLGRGFLIHNDEGPDLVIDGFTIINGSADNGGGILCDGSSPTILNCIILENLADYGGGVSIKDSAEATLMNCVIARNISTSVGAGGIDCVSADPVIVNCTITDNSSPGEAGGMSFIADSNALITNSILWADSPNEVYVQPGSSATITYSDIQGAWPGRGNINEDPLFASSLYAPVVSGLVAHWKFDEGAGTTASDSAGNNDGTIHGAQWVLGIPSTALRFDGIDDYVRVRSHPTVDVRNVFTFSVWIFKKGNGRTILCHNGVDPEYHPPGAYNLYAEDDLRITYLTYATGASLSTPPGSISLNTWHHVAVVFDASTSLRLWIYIDGVMRKSGGIINLVPRSHSTDLLIGRQIYSTDPYPFKAFNGAIDDVRIYDRPLSGGEIYQLNGRRSGYHLLPNSPCIDAGDPNYADYPDGTDLHGTKRVVGEAIDMGAYEAYAILMVSPQQLEFTANEGQPNPPVQTITIHNTGTRTLSWEITEDCDWLEVYPNSGTSKGEIDGVAITVDTTGLAEGVYDCNLTILDPDAGNSPQTVKVNLILHGPIIELSATEFDFHAEECGPNPPDKILTIRNSGGRTLDWTISENCNWLETSSRSGSSSGEPNEVALSVDSSGLDWGQYTCELTISDPCAVNNPQIVRVSLVVQAAVIELSATEFDFFWHNVINPEDQVLYIQNAGDCVLNWAITYDSNDCNWLDVSPMSGSSSGEPNEVILSVDVTGLEVGGVYECELTVSDPNAENNPQILYVRLCPEGCLLCSHLNYAEWVLVDKPECWCTSVNPRQCYGDADDDAQGRNNYWISTNDLNVLIAAWNKPYAEIAGQVDAYTGTPLICADFDHKPQGRRNYRVSANDLGILIANWNQPNGPLPTCP